MIYLLSKDCTLLLVCALTSPDFIATTFASNKHLYLKEAEIQETCRQHMNYMLPFERYLCLKRNCRYNGGPTVLAQKN